MLSTVSERLQQCYDRTGLSYRDLGAKTGISHSLINGAHNGKVPASLALVAAIAPVYRTTPQWLLEGDPRVNVFSDFLQTQLYRDTGAPSLTSGKRAAAVLTYLNDRYPGHLRYDDIGRLLDVSQSVVDRVLAGDGDPPDELIGAVADLSGVPASWIRVGNLSAVMTLMDERANEVTPDELQTLIELGAKAKAAGIPIESLGMLLDALGKAKGGA